MTAYAITITFEHDPEHPDAQGDELATVVEDTREQLRDVRVPTVSNLKVGKLMVIDATDDKGNRKMHVAACPWDTNGDGDCGRRFCPQCGKDAQ